jgi:hypothetical protein
MSSYCVPTLIAPTPTRMTPTPSGMTVPSPPRISVRMNVSMPPPPARVISVPPPAGIVLRLGEEPLRLRQPNWADAASVPLRPSQRKKTPEARMIGTRDLLDGKRDNALEAVEAPRCDLCQSSQAGLYG